MKLAEYLQSSEKSFDKDCGLMGEKFHGPGYHSLVENGTWCHTVKTNLNYSLFLLRSDNTDYHKRAAEIISKVLTLQDTDPTSVTFGVWPWVCEEPLEKMDRPDHNWADFCGSRLACILHDSEDKLDKNMRTKIRESLRKAALAIFRRNMGPGYTNIAIMGAGVTVAAGEILQDEFFLAYGKKRLENIIEHTKYHGTFNEYNSPAYTLVVIEETERILHLVKDESARKNAEWLRRHAWEIVARHFHPATSQWAGPHARAYTDRLRIFNAARIEQSTKAGIFARTDDGVTKTENLFDELPPDEIPVIPCPEDLQERFRSLPDEEFSFSETYIRSGGKEPDIVGTTWFSGKACISSVNKSFFWAQRRNLIGYWRSKEELSAVFRTRFLHDGRDFCSTGAVHAQKGRHILASVYSLENNGDYHPTLNSPKDNVFTATDFRFRMELNARGAKITRTGDLTWELRAGDTAIIIYALPGTFAGREIVWREGREGEHVFLDAICHEGSEEKFNFSTMQQPCICTGIELVIPGKKACGIKPKLSADGILNWNAAGGLKLNTIANDNLQFSSERGK